MKKLEKGDYIGQFLVEEVIRPLKDRNALLKVRYQGSYVRGYLCVVDARQYGGGYDTNEKLVHELQELCKRLMVRNENKASRNAFLPDHFSSCPSADGSSFVLGYFSCNNWCRESAPKTMDWEDLVGIATVLDAWHKKGIGHGSIHPREIQKIDNDSGWMFSCPIFPVMLSDEEAAWAYDFGNQNILKDRKVFCQMVSDVFNGDNDDKAFATRLKNFETNAGTIPIFSSFLSDTSVTCEQVVNSTAAHRKKTEKTQEKLKLRARWTKSIICFVILTFVCLVALSAVAFYKSQRTTKKHKNEVKANITDARDARDSSDWQTCKEKSQAILALQTNHVEALALKKEAAKRIMVTKALAEAREAQKIFFWQVCKKKSEDVLELEPQNIEALELKAIADGKMQLLSGSIEFALQAGKEKEWDVCLEKAQEALAIQPGHVEATELKRHAEKTLKLEQVLVTTLKAQENKDWVLCAQKADEALAIDTANPVALEFKSNAKSMLNKLSELRVQAYEAKQKKDWQVCADKATEALAIAPNDDQLNDLKSDAEKEAKLNMLLASALKAKEERDWQTCLLKTNAALLIEPEHLVATKLKLDAERLRKLFAALAAAREAKTSSQWMLCVEMASKAMEIEDEPEHSEAVALKSDAERKHNLIKALAAAHEAKAAARWLECKARAQEVLTIDPKNDEAIELKSHANRMQLAALFAPAHEAMAEKKWKLCLDKVNEVLLFDPENLEAKTLKEQAGIQSRIYDLLSECHDLKEKKEWKVCADKCDEVLRLDAGNVVATALKEDVIQGLKPYVIFKFFYNDTEVVGKVWCEGSVSSSSEKLPVKKNSTRTYYFWYKSARNLDAKVPSCTARITLPADWEGTKDWPINLTEKNKREERQLNDELKKWGVSSDQR